MISTADLKAAYDALNAEAPTYWSNELTIDANGRLIAPTDDTFYLIQMIDDPAFDDLDGEAFSRANLRVQSWDTRRGLEFAARDTADTTLVALGWERLRSAQVQTDGTRYGVTTTYVRTS